MDTTPDRKQALSRDIEQMNDREFAVWFIETCRRIPREALAIPSEAELAADSFVPPELTPEDLRRASAVRQYADEIRDKD
jgi:hypothetical protein